MKLGTALSLLLLLCWPLLGLAQITFERNYDYGYAEAANAVIQTADGGCLMAGRQGIAPFYAKGLLIKTDEYGDVQWQNDFWAGGDTYIYGVDEVSDSIGSGYVITGMHGKDGMGDNIFLARTDEYGDTLWLRSFGTTSFDRGWDVKTVPEGGCAESHREECDPYRTSVIICGSAGHLMPVK